MPHLYFLDEGEVKSYLISEVDQGVTIKAINQKIHFGAGERIQTTLSTKYNDKKTRPQNNTNNFADVAPADGQITTSVLRESQWDIKAYQVLESIR